MRCSTVGTITTNSLPDQALGGGHNLSGVTDHTRVSVQLAWNDWKSSEVCLGDLQDVHWFQPLDAPRPLLHAYVCPTKLPQAVVESTDDSALEPRRVCLLKSHTIAPVYVALASRANACR